MVPRARPLGRLAPAIMGVVKVVNMWPDTHQHMCMNEDGKSGVGYPLGLLGNPNPITMNPTRPRGDQGTAPQ